MQTPIHYVLIIAGIIFIGLMIFLFKLLSCAINVIKTYATFKHSNEDSATQTVYVWLPNILGPNWSNILKGSDPLILIWRVEHKNGRIDEFPRPTKTFPLATFSAPNYFGMEMKLGTSRKTGSSTVFPTYHIMFK